MPFKTLLKTTASRKPSKSSQHSERIAHLGSGFLPGLALGQVHIGLEQLLGVGRNGILDGQTRPAVCGLGVPSLRCSHFPTQNLVFSAEISPLTCRRQDRAEPVPGKAANSYTQNAPVYLQPTVSSDVK